MDLNTLAGWAQIISIPLAIIAIVVSIWLYRRGKQKRERVVFLMQLKRLLRFKMGEALNGTSASFIKGDLLKICLLCGRI